MDMIKSPLPTTPLESLLPLLLHRLPPPKPPRHSLARRSLARSHMLTTAQHTTESRRRLPDLRIRTSSSSRFASGRRLRLAGTNNQLGHLATSQHLHLADLVLFALAAEVALCFAVGACTLFLRELGIGFFFAGALGDGAGGGDPVVCSRVCAWRPVGEELVERSW